MVIEEIEAAIRSRSRWEEPELADVAVTARVAEWGQVLSTQVDSVLPEAERSALARHKSEHGTPDYLTEVNLRSAVRRALIEEAVAQVWEGFSMPLDSAEEDLERQDQTEAAEAERVRALPAMQRWTTEFAEEPGRRADEMSETLWPDRPLRWRAFADLLVQARIHDGMPLPAPGAGRDDPLVVEMTAAIDAEADEDAARARRLNLI